MAEVSIIGDAPANWSPKALEFASDLADLARTDREIGAMIVHVAMNIVGASAFEQGVTPREILSRVGEVADIQFALLRERKLQ